MGSRQSLSESVHADCFVMARHPCPPRDRRHPRLDNGAILQKAAETGAKWGGGIRKMTTKLNEVGIMPAHFLFYGSIHLVKRAVPSPVCRCII